MPRLPRFDQPGRWFHVMNRGLARRTVFESKQDVRYFLSRIAYAVRRGEIEVHAFCVMTTHYHLLVRSPRGQLSEAMRRIQNEYVRYFNRTRRRDGPLFRGRFLSKPVLSATYWKILVRYIDANPVQARLAKAPWEYPYGSAVRFVSGRVPKWLSSSHVLGHVARMREVWPTADYASVWGAPLTRDEGELVRTRIRGRALADDELDDLVRAAPPRVRNWMQRKAELADRTRPGLAMVSPVTVLRRVSALREVGRRWYYVTPKGHRRDAWGIAQAGLLRFLAGQTRREISERLGISDSMVTRRLRRHIELCRNERYALRLGRVTMLCIRASFARVERKVRNRS